MISNTKDLAYLTNKALCFVCLKSIDPDKKKDIFYHYEISLKRSFSSVAFVEGAGAGSGAILRFHVDCFENIAGKEYMFDGRYYK